MTYEVHDQQVFANGQGSSITENQSTNDLGNGNATGEVSFNNMNKDFSWTNISDDQETSETTKGFEHYMDKFKEMTELASSRNLEMMIAQTDYGTMLSAAKMRVNPV
ncbi:hypothetical protein [Roseobacter weihaiensis]|uniref:hypothetical protein n=1 Tax=Roseobacter weihaiensis TaxID=2763262 RepID=UPI001D0B3DDB|nr:hypothetical protein [Roseobacter sp. H9]